MFITRTWRRATAHRQLGDQTAVHGKTAAASAAKTPPQRLTALPRPEGLKQALVEALICAVGKDPSNATTEEWFRALAHYTRGFMAKRWLDTKRLHHDRDVKAVYYLSMEFLIGRSLQNNLYSLGLEEDVREAMRHLGVDLDQVYDEEYDAALGNGGLGRLAACFLDSLTTQGFPAYGYSIRYDNGMFVQGIENGWQVEQPEDWLRHGNPWEFPRPAVNYFIGFGGRTEHVTDNDGRPRTHWVPDKGLLATAYDLEVPGFGQDLINTIRLWSARPLREINLQHFNNGDLAGALRDKYEAEALSRVLYPGTSTEVGRKLRLRQEYFFVSASLQDILGRYLESGDDLRVLPDKVAIQLNDTHPAIAIPELMRLLIDQHGLEWPVAWSITTAIFAYTNHTLLPEALEAWPVDFFAELLPRHLEIIYRINEEFLADVAARFPGDDDLLRRVSIIGEDGVRHVRMGHLAFVGSHKVNGVSALHTDIMKASTFADFHRLYPSRIINKTNGISSRRWLNLANPALAALITSRIGEGWLSDHNELKNLIGFADDAEFRTAFCAIKQANKDRLSARIARDLGVIVNPAAMFDVQVKRIHEYKRQLLNALQVIDRYNRIRAGDTVGLTPRTVIFGGKAAADYHMAKLIIKLINDIAQVVNHDPVVDGLLKVLFIPNYSVTAAERIIPAADLSEQISTAGAEASGTGNMKLALNGALTIGTRDGANIEIGDAVGEDNIFFFGLSAEDVAARRAGGYAPHTILETDARLAAVLAMIRGGFFSPDDKDRYTHLVDTLLSSDYFMVLADFAAYVSCQDRIDAAYGDQASWTRKAIINVARMGGFSSDRTIRGYAEDIWQVAPCCLMPSRGADAA
ncbi:MAG: glycogen/starch/alpha-glucan phosphorylase [Sphingomonadales bacterium]|nr:glycogen/starch/alpha-glucan phosphorylase [Sphingomonadales bacterium]